MVAGEFLADRGHGDLADQAKAHEINEISALVSPIVAQHRSEQAEIAALKEAGRLPVSRNCKDCDNPISEVRLNAVPLAKRCVGCEEKAEEERRSSSKYPFAGFAPIPSRRGNKGKW